MIALAYPSVGDSGGLSGTRIGAGQCRVLSTMPMSCHLEDVRMLRSWTGRRMTDGLHSENWGIV